MPVRSNERWIVWNVFAECIFSHTPHWSHSFLPDRLVDPRLPGLSSCFVWINFGFLVFTWFSDQETWLLLDN